MTMLGPRFWDPFNPDNRKAWRLVRIGRFLRRLDDRELGFVESYSTLLLLHRDKEREKP
jgi:hypothetical protein